jgi:hypothetical protein
LTLSEADGKYVVTEQLKTDLALLRKPVSTYAEEPTLTLIGTMLKTLERFGFVSDGAENRIISVHAKSRRKLLIVMGTSEAYEKYSSLPGCVISENQFRGVLRRISSEWAAIQDEPFDLAYNCCVDLMSAFDWHSYIDSRMRRQILRKALDCYSIDCLVTSLTYLARTTFSRDQSAAHAIDDDVRWLVTARESWIPQIEKFKEDVASKSGAPGTHFDRVLAVRVT